MKTTIAERLAQYNELLAMDLADLDLELQLWERDPIRSIVYAQIEVPDTGPRITLWEDTVADIENRYSDVLPDVDRTDWLYEDVYQASQQYHAPFWAEERGSPHDLRYWHSPERDEQLTRSSRLLKELLASS